MIVSSGNLIALSSGLLVGLISGMLPGLTMLTPTLVLLPWLFKLTAAQIILWYATVLITHQFIGSVIATYYGVPNEDAHWPAVLEGYAMYKRGQGPAAIQAAAYAHVITMIMSLFLMLFISNSSTQIALFFDTRVQTVIILIVVAGVVAVNSEPVWVKILMLVTGTLLGFLGELNRNFMHLDLTLFADINFSDGIPAVPFIVGLFALPNCLKNNQQLLQTVYVQQIKVTFTHFRYYFTSILHGFSGFVFGLTPMLTNDVAANISYNVQKWWQKRTQNYHPAGDISCLVAAESAASSGAVISLMPLLLFGIPITASEALIFSVLNSKGYSFSLTNYDTYLIPEILGWLIIVCIVNYIISGPLSEFFSKLYLLLKDRALSIIMILLTVSVLYQGYNVYALKEYLTVMIFSFIIGYSFKKYNFYVMIFCFLMANHTLDIFVRMWVFTKIYLGMA
jgi:putative tricarboxylic transport membrane protein